MTLSYAVGQAYQLGILERTVMGFRGLEMKFSSPVYIGDTIHAELTVADTKAARRLSGGVVTLDLRISQARRHHRAKRIPLAADDVQAG